MKVDRLHCRLNRGGILSGLPGRARCRRFISPTSRSGQSQHRRQYVRVNVQRLRRQGRLISILASGGRRFLGSPNLRDRQICNTRKIVSDSCNTDRAMELNAPGVLHISGGTAR